MITRSIAAVVAVATLSAGAAHAAEDFQVGISGFLHNAISAADVDNSTSRKDDFAVLSDNLIAFSGASVLDNGLKATAVASFSFALGSDDSTGAEDQNNIYKEEIYVGLGGSFGQVDLGRRRNAASLLHTFIPSAGVGTFGVDDARTSAIVGGTTGFTTATSANLGGVNDYANRIQYFTPRIEGLQLAASFTPDGDADGANGGNSLQGGIPLYANANVYKNEYSVAANYTRSLEGVGVVASVGYTVADSNSAFTAGARDFESLQGGLQLSTNGFTIGGAYGELESANQTGVGSQFTTGKDRRYGGGVKYETGPWGFGLSYLHRKASGTTQLVLANGQAVRKSHLWELGGTYDLGPGVTVGSGIYYNDNEDRTAGTGTGTEAEDSIAGVLNLSVNF